MILDTVYHKDSYAHLAEGEILGYFHDVIFNPLFIELGTERLNANDALGAAILAGTLVYGADGIFRGPLSAAISFELRQLGAIKTPAGFALAEIPPQIRVLINQAKAKRDDVHHRILALLALIAAGVAAARLTGITFEKTVDKMTEDLQKQFAGSVSSIPGQVVQPTPPDLKEQLKTAMQEQTNQAIKGFTQKSTSELRAKVEKNLQDGGSTERLAKIIEAEYGVSKRKAAFIAENETSGAVAAFRQARYESIGCKTYLWRTMEDGLVRPTHGESNNHRVLNGRVFPWASAPVVDPATGRRRHPGQDYNCRCVALPILNLT